MIGFPKFFISPFAIAVLFSSPAFARQSPLPYSPVTEEQITTDWLISPVKQKAAVYYSADKKSIILYNGLIRRVFALQPGLACIDYKNMSNGQQLLRAVQPEAKIEVDKVEYKVGASVSIMGATPVRYQLGRDYQLKMNISLEPGSYKWIVIE